MVIIVSRTPNGPMPIHAVYQVGANGLHAIGRQLGKLRVVRAKPDVMIEAWETKVFSFSGPVLFPVQAAASGQRAWTCVTAAGSAFIRGWIRFW